MTRSGIAHRLQVAVKTGRNHTSIAAVDANLASLDSAHDGHAPASVGVDLSVIAMWLGHETTQTTHQYLDADLELKKRALACLEPPRARRSRRSCDDDIVQFLKGL